MQRRSFLKSAAFVAVMVANGDMSRAVVETSPEYPDGPAFEPWKTWHADDRRDALSLVHAAILSANAFNTQPWLFKVSQSVIEVYADTRRNLGAFDTYLRELHFSLGCALENLLLDARAQGYETSLALFPGKLQPIPEKPEPALVARVSLAAGKPQANELHAAIPHRHTNRAPFEPDKLLDKKFLADLAGLKEDDVKFFLFTHESERKKLVDLIIASGRMMADPKVQSGTRPWLRMTMDQWEKNPDGTYIGPSPFQTRTLQDYASLMMSGPLFGVITVRDRYDRPQTMRAGRLWQRAHLLATARNLAARPANGAVEIIDYERSLQQEPKTQALIAKAINDQTWQPTFMFYMGYPTIPAPASARRRVSDVVL